MISSPFRVSLRNTYLILQNSLPRLEAAIRYRRIFPWPLYLELIAIFSPAHWLNGNLCELGEELAIPVVVTNNVHYTEPEYFPLHDALTALRTNTTLKEVHPQRRLNAENYLKSAEEMSRLWSWCPQGIAASWEIAQMCSPALDLNRRLFPAFPTPPGVSADEYLRQLVFAGAKERYGRITSQIQSRLEHELDVIARLQVADYFLVVWDIARQAREWGIRYGAGFRRRLRGGLLFVYYRCGRHWAEFVIRTILEFGTISNPRH